MALTLVEASKLSNDVLLTGVIETIVKDSPILQSLPFIEIVGNGLTYNRENAAATAAFYNIGDTWVESTGSGQGDSRLNPGLTAWYDPAVGNA